MSDYRLVKDDSKSSMFGVNLTIDEQALLKEMGRYIEKLKDKYVPDRDILHCRLIPDPASFTHEPRKAKP